MDNQQPDPVSPKLDETRRRLTQGGLAAPVVVASLLAKPALGAVPYKCTISGGKLSGNFSTHDDTVNCASLGGSPGCWKNRAYKSGSWPIPPETKFKDKFKSGLSYSDKTLYEVLWTGGSGDGVDVARAAIATLLNALHFGAPANYPVTADMAKNMFNSTVPSGTVVVGPGPEGTWDKNQVKTYFESLYGGEDFDCPGGI